MTPEESLARRRYVAINLIRLSGLAMVLLSLLIHAGKIPGPAPVAYILGFIGLADFFFMPVFLARKWKTPRQ